MRLLNVLAFVLLPSAPEVGGDLTINVRDRCCRPIQDAVVGHPHHAARGNEMAKTIAVAPAAGRKVVTGDLRDPATGR